ncbi:hypothetical protein EOA23_06190 [Mesorhizobium sp. M2A.F.Ca.ET.042.01.1.1]|uniref:DUF5801 repeats-in-toxin domain-containing protein n=1 Tax=Mesorhizobium sp. M2A.F.Ca.ET.042.01.1.1 TaxID=2496745 RepID=UPI000FCA0C40|nr:DUF5801 repeats-in-toxin domain-containing protein [Mesorhizobium sp. M2A.F.Ca.ET.042.01.1.1]RUX33581.1 hypothetical protein EOA23_06190 [Mesorhizobium sp. M2A.F.Ca.ET.042.01.1.1]
MTISFILNDQAVNDQTTGLQTGDNIDDAFTDTDVAYSSLPAGFRTYLETTLGLSSAFPTSIGVATKTNSVTVNATAGSQLAGTTFTDTNGGALDGDNSGLTTVDGKAILLYADGSNTVIGKYDSDGNGSADAIAFVIFKQDSINAGATSDQVTFNVVTYVPTFHSGSTNPDDAVNLGNTLKLAATETLNFGFAGAPSGSNLFMTFGDPNSTQIVVIGRDPLNQSQGGTITTKDVLNISQAGSTTSFGVNGNAINPTEGAFITYVTGTNTNFLVPNLDQNEADVEANIDFQNVVNATGASFTVNQTNPGVGPVTVKITAYSTAYEPGAGFVDGLTNDTKVNITSASVTDFVVKTGNTQYTPVATVNADGTLTITGLSTGDKVSWTTTDPHNRVLIENVSNTDSDANNDNNTFDIGGFGIVTSSGSSTFVGQQIVIEDDGPSITASATGAPTLTVDETVLATDATAGFAAQFTKNYGTDGQGATPVSYALSTPGGASGLTDTATGESVVLSLVNGQILGKTATTGLTVFVVSVDSSGQVTLDQQRAIVHANPNDPNESRGLTGSNLVVLTATATDGDGDHAAAPLDLTPLLAFKDDGPSITASAIGASTLTVDETVLTTDAQASFAAQFTPTFGNDGQGATPVSYALSTPGGASGLTDTATGESVVLSLVNGQILGKTATTALTVFVVSVDSSGQVTLDQRRAIVHANPNDPDETRGLTGSNLVVLTATATDGDGDHAAAPLDLTPLLAFKDDGPSITVNNITNGTYAAGGSSTWPEGPGADGFKSLNITLNNYTIDGHSAVTVNSSLGTATTTDANGNYVFNGTINADFNTDGISDSVAFTLAFKPGADTYTIAVTTPPPAIVNFDTSQGSLTPGGPNPVQTLTFSSGPAAGQSVVFFGAVATAPAKLDNVADTPPNDILDLVGLGQPDLTKAQINGFLTPTNQIPTLINGSTQMNVSTSGIGINNNNLDGSAAGIQSTDESFVVNPSQLVDQVKVFIDNSVGGYDPGAEDLEYRIYYSDGTVGANTKVLAADLSNVTSGVAKGGKSFVISDVAGGPQIDAVQLTMANGTIKIPVIQFTIQQSFLPEPLNMNLTATLTDGDNDTKQSQFSIALA